jgi:plastocyanin
VLPAVLACAPVAAVSPVPTPPVDVTITSAGGETPVFRPAETVVAAARPISITFQNASHLPHNLTFIGMTGAATRTIVDPGTSDNLLLAPLAAGAYPFVCTIHEGMAGILTIRAG